VHRINYRIALPALVVLGIALALLGVKQRDPFRRVEFSLATPGSGSTKALAVLPKPDARFPVVIYVHGSGRTVPSVGDFLRQIADLGMAAVGIEYNQTNQAVFNEQFAALQEFVQRQPWAQSNAVAWVGMSLGAQRTLQFIRDHPESQPQLLVRMAGEGKVEDGGQKTEDGAPVGKGKAEVGGRRTEMSQSLLTSAATKEGNAESGKFTREYGEQKTDSQRLAAALRCPVLLVHGEFDEVFPMADAKRLAALLETNGVATTLHVVPGAAHNFGENHALVLRATAEYCRANLPPADYTAGLSDCRLTEAERRRFNLAMQRAGGHRRELWLAVAGAREPERRTLMMVIGGLEDYDVVRMKSASLQETARVAWQARRTYPWSANTPLDIFESVTANPRCFEEPIEDWRGYLSGQLHRRVKYCRTTAEVSDAIWRWMHRRVGWKDVTVGVGKTPRQILSEGQTDCFGLVVLYTALCRSIGLAERPTEMVRQNPDMGPHFCSEVWVPEDGRWRELDSSADGRNYHSDWVRRIAKAMILTTTGERGDWNALVEKRLDRCLNTIGLVYPSGTVRVQVLNGGEPVAHAVVGIQIAASNYIASLATQRTDASGRAEFTLGRTVKFPYRVLIDQVGDTDWQWLTVESNATHQLVLDLANRRPLEREFTTTATLTTTNRPPNLP
jgi:dienelactone hydrolase